MFNIRIFLRTILHLTSSNNLPVHSIHVAETPYTGSNWHILQKASEIRGFKFYAFYACPIFNEALVIVYSIYLSKITIFRNVLYIAYSWPMDYNKPTQVR